MSAFENFINTEMPKRISTNENPLAIPEGHVFVTTGVGLSTVTKPYVAEEDIDISADPLAYYILAKS